MNLKRFLTVEALSGAMMGGVGLASFVLSFENLRGLAEMSGVPVWLSWLWPLVIDITMLAAAVAVLRRAQCQEKALWQWVAMFAFSVASVAFNTLHGAGWYNRAVIDAVPPIALLVAAELLVGQIRYSLKRKQVGESLQDTIASLQRAQQELSYTIGEIGKAKQELAALPVASAPKPKRQVSKSGKQEAIVAPEIFQRGKYQVALLQAYQKNPSAKAAELAKVAGCSRETARKFLERQ